MMKAYVFIPCFIDQFYPDIGFNTLKILKKVGVEPVLNVKQTCCGQPSLNSGYWKPSRKLMKKFFKDFNEEIPVISPIASCMGYIKRSYHLLFEHDVSMMRHAEGVSERLYELTDFLVNVLNVTDLGAKFPHRITFHDSCSALREYGIKSEPRALLNKVSGLELVEMEKSEECCGFGGTFSAKFPDVASAMADKKMLNGLRVAPYMVMTEASCMMNMCGYVSKNSSPLKVLHISEILSSF